MQKTMRNTGIRTGDTVYNLSLSSEDLSSVYPGMIRYVLEVRAGEEVVAKFSTNTYEYSPTNPLQAESVAMRMADRWEEEIRESPQEFLASANVKGKAGETGSHADVVIIQGSPRADGNSGILAGWALETAQGLERSVEVIYPHDLGIRPCIGCYQCYNTGSCAIEDEMRSIIRSVAECSLLIVCSPVYTNSVPGSLKVLVDRFMAYHAKRLVSGGKTGQRGLIFSVSGRKGMDNFTCVTRVLDAFMRNIGIVPSGELLLDGMDRIHDIRAVPGVEERTRSLVREAIGSRG
ncbi:MAG: flavodoxin family protein [Methanoregulaceae archaeon]|nr:flavodoxin family protein [Methanoregulaceae archaeon]